MNLRLDVVIKDFTGKSGIKIMEANLKNLTKHVELEKVTTKKQLKGKNKFAVALRNAANTIDRIKYGALNSFFKRIAYKKGRAAAITATARKIAIIIWNMIMKKQSYQPPSHKEYQEMIKAKKLYFIHWLFHFITDLPLACA